MHYGRRAGSVSGRQGGQKNVGEKDNRDGVNTTMESVERVNMNAGGEDTNKHNTRLCNCPYYTDRLLFWKV